MHLRHVRRLTAAALAVALLALVSHSPDQAEGVAEFYRANPVNLLIGFPVANAYDTYGRAVARHLGKHIPGSPSVIPVNRPGAGSLTAANFLYNGAPKDGSTIALFNRSVPLEPLMGNSQARFDVRKFNWLGSVGNRSEEHTSELQSLRHLVCRPLRSTRFPYTTLFRSQPIGYSGEPARSRQPYGGELPLQRCTQGRLDNRPLQPQRAAGAADGKFPGALRRPEIQLARECRQ